MWKDPINVQVTSKNTLEVLFEDGIKGQIIFNPSRFRGVFKSLEDESIFNKVFVDRETGAIAWENGLDLAPDVMYDQIKAHGQWVLK
jgi:hypothetical protein